MSSVHNEISVMVEEIGNLNVDECVKSALMDEVNKAKFFAGKSERLTIKHIGAAKTFVLGIKRHQRMTED